MAKLRASSKRQHTAIFSFFFPPPSVSGTHQTVQLDVLSTTVWIKRGMVSQKCNDARLVSGRTHRQQVKLLKCSQQSENVCAKLDGSESGSMRLNRILSLNNMTNTSNGVGNAGK